MTDTVLLAIDQGTTSSRAILFSPDGVVLDVRQRELPLIYPQAGWVEQDPETIWNDTLWACRGIEESAQSQSKRIAGIGITNQRETTIVWDRATGAPVYNAIVWQDRRTADFCDGLREAGHENRIRAKTGLLLDPYFSASKIRWILDNVEGVRARAERGDLAFGTVDCFLLWHLTGGKVHASDATNASRTMLYNIVENRWDEDLLALFDIPRTLLPEVRDNASDFGTTAPEVMRRSYAVGGMAGDQQAALIGQACFQPGMAKSTYGTGCFALIHIGETFRESRNRLLTTTAYKLGGKASYAIEGSIFIAGAAIQWLRDGLHLFDKAAKSEDLARSVPNNGGVYFVPAFTGLGAPYWRPDARGLLTGIGRETTAAHLARAALEAQAYQTLDLVAAMEADSGTNLEILRADGGLVTNVFMCQFLADMLDRKVQLPHVIETTAWGAASLAGLQAGVFNDLSDISQAWRAGKSYEPRITAEERGKLYAGWKAAISKVLA